MSARDPHADHLRVGVDIGGTKTEAVIVDAAGAVVHALRRPTGHGPNEVIASAVTAVTGLATAAGCELGDFGSIGIGIPGRVDSTTGVVSHAINLGVEHLELGHILAERFGVAVRVENDVNAAALGAFHVLGQPATASVAYLNLGTGLAAGLVLRGELWRGARGAAGEIAAQTVRALVMRLPDAVLGLATGSTPVSTYRAIAALQLDLSRARLRPRRVHRASRWAPGELPFGDHARSGRAARLDAAAGADPG